MNGLSVIICLCFFLADYLTVTKHLSQYLPLIYGNRNNHPALGNELYKNLLSLCY